MAGGSASNRHFVDGYLTVRYDVYDYSIKQLIKEGDSRMDADRAFKDAIYEQIARVGRAVAHPHRLELLDFLCQGPMTVEQLARKSAMSVANTSQHLQHLRGSRLIQVEPKGTTRLYRLADDATCRLFRTLRSLAERYYAEMRATTDSFLRDRDALDALDARGLQQRLTHEPLVLLDVRPPEEYAAGHWPGAVSLPVDELANRLAQLPRDVPVVAYCRGPYCVLALQAVEILREHGFQAVRLAEGVSDWRAQGLPVAIGREG